MAKSSNPSQGKFFAEKLTFNLAQFSPGPSITEGSDVGTIQKVCSNPACPVHHPTRQTSRDEKWKAEQEKQRRDQAVANATGLRVLAAVGAAVPVRLMKRDLLFILEKLTGLMDENRVAMLARQHGIRQNRDDGGVVKTYAGLLRRSDEGTLSRLVLEMAILLASARTNAATVLRDAASIYKVDTDAITLKVKQEFATKEKARKAAKAETKPAKKTAAWLAALRWEPAVPAGSASFARLPARDRAGVRVAGPVSPARRANSRA
jgi:ParB family chromosome partitioning protein